MVIRASDRVSEVLAQDAALLPVLASASPAFARLAGADARHPMARLATVEDAARMAGMDPEALVDLLNRALRDGAPLTLNDR